jgi:hypothetical protein
MLDFTPAFSDVCSDALLEAHEAEIKRLEAIKAKFLQSAASILHKQVEILSLKFVEACQFIFEVVDFSEEEMLDFTPAFSDVCSDALLEAHEAEIKRLEAIHEARCILA